MIQMALSLKLIDTCFFGVESGSLITGFLTLFHPILLFSASMPCSGSSALHGVKPNQNELWK